MNKIYKVVWSKARNCYVVASELAKRHTKAPKSEVIARTVVAGILACTLSSGVTMSAFAESYEAGGGQAIGEDSVAIGDGSVVNTDNSIAIGTDNTVDNLPYAIVIGSDNTVSNVYGDYAVAGGYSGAVLIGNHVSAERQYGGKRFDSDNSGYDYDTTNHVVYLPAEDNKIAHVVGIGDDITVGDEYGLAIGSSSKARRLSSTAIGHNAKAEGVSSLAIGTNTTASDFANAIGLGANAEGDHSVAISKANTKGEYDLAVGFGSTVSSTKGKNIAVGYDSKVTGTATNAIGLGTNSSVSEDNAVAIGGYSSSDANKGVAIGYESMTQGANSVAIGSNSVASDDNVVSFGRTEDDAYYIHGDVKYTTGIYDDGEIGVSGLHVSGGTQNPGVIKRRLVNVADGIDDSDVATVGQLTHFVGVNRSSTENQFFDEDSTVPNYDGSGASGVSSIAIGPRAIANSHSTTAVGVESSAKGLGSTSLGWHATSEGQASIALGGMSKAKGDYDVALGFYSEVNSTGGNNIVIGTGADISGTGVSSSIAVGNQNRVTKSDAVAIGNNASSSAEGGIALGKGTSVSSNNSVAIGSDSVANQDNVVSFGRAALPYDIIKGQSHYEFSDNFDSLEVVDTSFGDVAVGNEVPELKRRLIHVADGIDDSDVATVGQLNSAVANVQNSLDSAVANVQSSISNNVSNIQKHVSYVGTHFISGNNKDGSGAYGSNTIAIGSNAYAEGNNDIVVGRNSSADDIDDAILIGRNNKAVSDGITYEYANNATPVVDNGDGTATSSTSVIIGDITPPSYFGAVLVGNDNTALATNGTGRYNSDYDSAIAHVVGVGDNVKLGDKYTVGLGYNAKATSISAVGIGRNADAKGESSIAFGTDTNANGHLSTAVGWDASSAGFSSIAIGSSSGASGSDAIAIGTNSNASGYHNVAIGNNSAVSKSLLGSDTPSSSVAIGDSSHVALSNAVAIGSNVVNDGLASVAIGSSSYASGDNSIAIGSNSIANQDDVVSFGKGSYDLRPTVSDDGLNLITTEDGVAYNNVSTGGCDYPPGDGGEVPPEYKRRLIHVADGINDSDVATVGQVRTMVEQSGSQSGSSVDISNMGTGNSVTKINNPIVIGRNSTVNNTYQGSQIAGDYEGSVLIGNNISATPDNGTGRYGSNDLFEITNNLDGTVNVPNEFEKVAHAVGIGDGVKIGDMDTVAIGSNAKATSKSATAVGHGANASSERSVALGMRAKASGLMSSALGFGSSASGMGSSALGSSSAKGDFDIALGWDASIKSTKGSNTAIGYESTIKENTQDAIALGSRSNVSKSNAVAIGTHSNVQGNNGVALGERTLVDANSSVAIGSNSVASDDNVVSFGRGVNDPLLTESQVNYRYSRNGDELVLTKEEIVVANQMVGTPEEYKRRLIHVADGINDSDVATVGQVTAMLQNSVTSNSINYYGVNSTGGSNVNGEEAIGINAIAIGKDAAGVDKNTTAVGSHAWAIASGSVALGADSIATSSDEVSVGHQGGSYEYMNGNVGHGSSYSSSDGGDGSLYRRITNMKDGVGDHDAVTVGQMNRAVADFATSDSLDTKANIDLDNISDDGVNTMSAIAQRSMKVVAGQNTTVVESTDDNVKTYVVNVATNGAIAEGNEGIVTGGAIYDALQNVSAGTGEITPYTAGDGIAISNTKQISVVKDGEVEHGNTGLVTGGQVYDKLSAYNENLTGILDGIVSGIEDDLDTKAKKNLSNLDNSGKNVIRGLAQNSIQLNAGQNTNLTVTASDGKLNYTIDTVANGEVANNNTGLMSGGAVYNEVRPVNGNYIANNKTVAENLTVLDTSIKNVSDRVDALGGTIADTTVVRYDSDTKDKLTLNGTQGTTLTNLKNGVVTASSTDAVTGSQLYSVKRSVDDHTTAINTLQSNVTENANAITALDGRVTSMEEIVTSAFNTAEEIQTTVGGLETTVGNMQTTVDEMQDTVSGLATDVDGVKSTVASLQGDFATMQEDVSGLQNDVTSIKSDVSDVKDTLGTVQADTAQIKENVTALQSDVGTLQQDIEAKANADGSNIDVAKFIEKMKAGENGVVTSEDLYVATRAQEDGTFVRKDASLSDNLLALDDGINRLNENVGKSHGLSVNFKNINDANYNGAGATGDNAMAIGPSAEASGEDSIAIGNGSKASGLQSIALGTGNQVSGNHSGAFGDPNEVTGDGSYAFGNDNTVSGNNTFVLGNNVSNASGNNTVVLGNGSDGSMDNVVSVGAEGAERKIVHVAKGDISQNSTDAVTGGQLFDVQEDFRNAQGINADKWTQALGTGTVEDGNDNLVTGGTVFDAIKDLQIAQDVVAPNYATGHIDIGGNQKYDMIDTINVAKSDGSGRVITGIITDPGDVTSAANVGYVNAIGQNIADGVNEGFRKIDDKFSKAGASAAAMASLTPPPMDGDEKWAFSAAVGHYDGETAGAVGAFYRPQDNVIVNVRGAVGNGEDMVGAGVGVALQRGNTPSVSKAQLVRTVNAQAEKLQAQDNRMAEQSQVINEQNEKIASMQEQMMQMQETLRRLSEKSGM